MQRQTPCEASDLIVKFQVLDKKTTAGAERTLLFHPTELIFLTDLRVLTSLSFGL